MIQIQALSVKYPGRKRPVLNQVSFQVRKGETLLILGPSGSGKSSLALTMNGLVPNSLGEILGGFVQIDGLDTQEKPIAELAQHVGIVFQDPDSQFATMKVEDEIVFGLENLRVRPEEMDARVDLALSQVGMQHARQRQVSALSGGEKQRIALASLLAMQPRVLVFDEPTANLDSVGTQQVFALLAELKARGQHTIVLIEHKLDELMHLVDRVLVLNSEGQVIADGPARQIFDERGAELKDLGVWMPQVSLLAHELRKLGAQIDYFPITLGEAVKGLGPILSQNAKSTDRSNRIGQRKNTIFEMRELSFSYGDMPALRQASLRVDQGDFLAIVGPNGAGKSTLAKHLIGLLTPPLGSVYFDGIDLDRIPAKELAQRVSYVFQNPEHQFVTENIVDEVAYGLRVMKLPENQVQTQSAQLLEKFGLSRYAKSNPFTLSHGEKRRLSVAAMLAMGQDVLILDEPTFGQDERNAAALMGLLSNLNAQGKTVVMITHDMRLVAEYAHKVAVMLDGRVHFYGEPSDLFSKPDLLAAAHLNLPPLSRLSALFSARYPQLSNLSTLKDFLNIAQPAMDTETARA